jgi:acetolactate synthase-1/2/3 large subunit
VHERTTGAQLVLDILADEGVDTMFGYPGGTIMPLYDKMVGGPIHHILTRHEQAAAFAAGGYARSTGRVGVCVATSGPGATNLLTGLLDALMDSIPVVAITGQVRTGLMGTDGFQEADVASIFAAATKRAVCVRNVDDLERTMRAAFRVARGPRPGPVLVDIPTDVLKASCRTMSPRQVFAQPADTRTPADAQAIERALDLIAHAKRPVAIVGGGAKAANAVELFRSFCAMLKLPYAATINAIGCSEPGDDRYLGMIGMHGWKEANVAAQHSDVIIALGMRFDDRVTGRVDRFAQHAKIIHADIDASEFGKIIPIEIALRGDLRDTLARLVAGIAARPDMPTFEHWAAQVHAARKPLPRDRAPHGEMSATDLLDRFFAKIPEDAIVVTDVGQHQMWAAQRQHTTHPRSYITSAGLGAMGFGLPAAIGAKIANPKRPVFAICGDGGLQMSIAELATIHRYELPLKILLIDNRRLGMVRQWQELFYDRNYSATELQCNPDFVAVARGYGLRAAAVASIDEADAALDSFLRSPEAMLLHCECFQMENVWPLIPPGATIEETMEGAPVAAL